MVRHEEARMMMTLTATMATIRVMTSVGKLKKPAFMTDTEVGTVQYFRGANI